MAEPKTVSCCTPTEQASCCEPSEKAGCCGGGGEGCGCRPAESEATPADPASLKEAVRERYAVVAAEMADGDPQASLGCGNPVALAALGPGEVVLDLGSGGGLDVLASARRVGPTGKAYGLDMTDEMLELARRNQREAGIANAEFIKGSIEGIPLPDRSVDVIVSNCVINLSADKRAVFREAARVLKPGGRLAVSDIVADPEMDEATRRDLAQWTGCIAGALTEEDFRRELAAAGFEEIEIEAAHRVHDHAMSSLIRARRP